MIKYAIYILMCCNLNQNSQKAKSLRPVRFSLRAGQSSIFLYVPVFNRIGGALRSKSGASEYKSLNSSKKG